MFLKEITDGEVTILSGGGGLFQIFVIQSQKNTSIPKVVMTAITRFFFSELHVTETECDA